MLPYPQGLASGAEPPKSNRADLPKEPRDNVLCSTACWEGWSCHHDAQSNLIPPSILGPEMQAVLQGSEGGRLGGRAELLRGGKAGKGVLGAGTVWVKPHFPFRVALGK